MGCEGVGAFQANEGSSFNGASMAGARMAYATKPGKWVVIYIDCADKGAHDAMKAFATAALAPFGPLKGVRDAKIGYADNGSGDCTVTVDGGKVMKLKSKMVKGGDGKTPIAISNIHDPVHPTVMMGTTVSCTYSDKSYHFKLSESNAYFNAAIDSSGNL